MSSREKQREYQRRWRATNRDRANEQSRRWAAAHPEKVREKSLKRFYGISLEQYNAMLVEQGGVCAGCGGPPTANGKFYVDHNHQTGRVRGLLCHHCNVSIGYAKDDPSVLDKLAAYLRSKE